MSGSPCIFWFRRDLRLADNPGLHAALQAGPVIPVYIHGPNEAGHWPDGSASRWWLHYSLQSLDEEIGRLGSRLLIQVGPSLDVLRRLAEESGAGAVFWNRLYEPAAIARDTRIKAQLRAQGLEVRTFNSALLVEPWSLTREKSAPYKVFTPFWKALQIRGFERPLHPAPNVLPPVPSSLRGLPVQALELLPKTPWDGGMRDAWKPGEEGAQTRLQALLPHTIDRYRVDRDRPDLAGTSRLSPHLHFGEIGPAQIVQSLRSRTDSLGVAGGAAGSESYLREIAWREFAHHLLYHFPEVPETPMDRRFQRFPWATPEDGCLTAWRRGRTGIPLVDAGMRELWHTGWMHNRVRMVVASLLVKNLRIHWREGALWFWDTLVDADLANNTLGWQWCAGCGADAAPYFRIFNPVLQGERFDPAGDYVRCWVPELSPLPAPWIHQPWAAPQARLDSLGIRLGRDYPLPIVDLKSSRVAALAAFQSLRSD